MISDEPAATTPTKIPENSIAGRIYLCILGLSVALAGLLFFVLMARSYLRAKDMRTWPNVPCMIISSEIEQRQHDDNSKREYRQSLSYGYEWQGQPRTGDHVSLRNNPWTSKEDLIQERVAQYPVGLQTTCFVDPTNPNFSVLKPDSLAPGYSIWFPSLFIIGGIGITVRAAIGARPRR